MLKLVLLGYGKMGRAVEQEALARGHIIVSKINRNNAHELLTLTPETADVVIEFTHPDQFETHLTAVLGLGLPMVSGTTGWYDRLAAVQAQVTAADGALMYSANFSVGVNLLFKLNQQLAAYMNQHPGYDPYIEEQHHRHKADTPSGTAVRLAQQIITELDRKTRIAEDLSHRAPEPDELSIGAVRAGGITGVHRVSWVSEIDEITLEHRAFSRRGFALGAVIAAERLIGKKGCYLFSDVL